MVKLFATLSTAFVAHLLPLAHGELAHDIVFYEIF
jgi:hypothetical protein